MENIFSRVSDGLSDASEFLQSLLDSENREIHIPQGCYLIKNTLKVHSDTKITASPNARFVLDGSVKRHRGDYLLTNADTEKGNQNIEIFGGVWDGNNKGEGNAKPDIFDKNGYSGTVLNFCNVKNLKLYNFVVANSVTYNVRMAKIDGFEIENISFLSDAFGQNQDGLHFNGYCKNGRVKNIRALSKGQTNDDLIALNADDSMERVENFGMVRGPIENITFENLFAEDCHTVIRILSVDAPIRNISIKNVYGGYRCYAINGDGARYCRTPLFKENDRPQGVGLIENVHIENMCVYPTKAENENPAIAIESLADNFTLKNFRLASKNGIAAKTAFFARNLVNQTFTADGKEYVCNDKEDAVEIENFTELSAKLK